MPGLSSPPDPRFLQQQIDDLKTRLKKLEASSIPFAANQQGALPGHFRGNMIGDGGLASSMFLNLMGNTAGVAPRLSVKDQNKQDRAEAGNLAAVGNSPAQWGFRALDGSGNPIFDSMGLIAVMQQQGFGENFGSSTTSTTYAVVAGTSFSFTLTRSSRIYIIVMAQGYCVNLPGYISAFVDGAQGAGGIDMLAWGGGGVLTTSSWAFSQLVNAGAHTIDLRAKVAGAATTLSWNFAVVDSYLMGAV